MRPRRKTPARTPAKKVAAIGGGWPRMVVVFVLGLLIFWLLVFKTDLFSAISFGSQAKPTASAQEATVAAAEDGGSEGAGESSSGGEDSGSAGESSEGTGAGSGADGGPGGDGSTPPLQITPAGVNDTSTADIGELEATTAAKVMTEKLKAQEEGQTTADGEGGTGSGGGGAASTLLSWGKSLASAVRRRSSGPKRHYRPVNGSFPLAWYKPKKRFLRERLDSAAMQRVFLDASRFGKEVPEGATAVPAAEDGSPLEASKGPECPDMEFAYDGFDGIASCYHADIEDEDRVPSQYPANCAAMDKSCQNETDHLPHEKWAAQVILLQNVYINVAGQIFNRTHFFDHDACTADLPFKHLPGRTRVTRYNELLSLVDWYGWNARTILIDTLPMFVALDAVLPFMKGIPVAFGHRSTHRRNQMEQMVALGSQEFLGVRLERLAPQILSGDELFFAEKLFVPLHQRCGRPSRALWSYIRTRYLLPPQGLPMYRRGAEFKSNYRRRPGRQVFTAGSDWVVLIGYKDEPKKPLVESLKLRTQLLKYLPAKRVEMYKEGSLSYKDRKRLLNRALMLVSVHDNLLADLVFMPPRAIVFELRPVDEPDPTFHHLAEACNLEYHLYFTEGRKATRGKLRVADPRALFAQLRIAAKRVLKMARNL